MFVNVLGIDKPIDDVEIDHDIHKYYVWKDGEHADSDGFFDYEDAIEYAKEIDADEIEKTTWYSQLSYQNREPADEVILTCIKQLCSDLCPEIAADISFSPVVFPIRAQVYIVINCCQES